MHQKIIILDFGSQYTQLIARRIRELNVYCEIHPWNKIPELDSATNGVILSGSPFSVLDKGCGSFLIVFILTLCGWVPGVIAALVILNNTNNKFQ